MGTWTEGNDEENKEQIVDELNSVTIKRVKVGVRG